MEHRPELLLVGANPCVRLFDGETDTGFASVWRVDWSVRGRGDALVLWHDGQVRVLGSDPELAYWLADYFTRHFPEVAGLPWPEPRVERADVRIALDLAYGLTAEAGDVTVRMAGVLARRTYATDAFALDGVPHGLSLVVCPVAEAGITVAGRALPGEVKREGTPERPSSSAFLADAEVWSR